MKRTLTLISFVAICCAMMVSCKNSKTTEPTAEEVQAQKQALADSVLAKIDEIAEQYWNAQAESPIFATMKLTDEEKLVKPDYLLDPSVANTLVTKSQKINALAIYVTDIAVCKAYDMPYEGLREAAIKLATELDVPFDMEITTSNEPISEKIKATYKACKERGELSLFWQFEYGVVAEFSFILSQNPELLLSKITEEEWQAFNRVKKARVAAIEELAKYDEEMALLCEFRAKNRVTASKEESVRKNQSIETAKQYYIANKAKYAAKRNALLQ